MKFETLWNDSERAVSPVIGVILMVAITVILAAVIGSMVMGLADDVGQTTPNANLQTNTVGDGTVTDGAGPEPLFELEHNGGDAIPEGEYEIQLREGTSGQYTTLYAGGTPTDLALSDNTDVNITLASAPGEISTGDVVEFTIENNDGSGSDYDYTGTTLTLQIVHTESDGTVITEEIEL